MKLENIFINLVLRMTNASILSILVEVHYYAPAKVTGRRGGGILWRPPSRTACYFLFFKLLLLLVYKKYIVYYYYYYGLLSVSVKPYNPVHSVFKPLLATARAA